MSKDVLYLKYRPTKFSEVVGQDKAIETLMEWGRKDTIPHFILFSGPSGCGKTTLARILAAKLKCTGADFQEVNASDNRGIDMTRGIIETYGISPLSSPCRIYLIDEAQALTPEAQGALLKPLEEPPDTVYFIFCTTDPQKLRPAIQNRASILALRLLTPAELMGLMRRVVAAEGVTIDEAVLVKIADAAEGCARQALVLLHAVIGLPSTESQLQAITKSNTLEEGSFRLAKALYSRESWSTVAKILRDMQQTGESNSSQVERVRAVVLGYGKSWLIKGGDKDAHVAQIMEEFRDPFYSTGEAGLVLAAYNATH